MDLYRAGDTGKPVEREILSHVIALDLHKARRTYQCGVKALSGFPKLRNLSISLSRDTLVSDCDKQPWLDDFDDTELLQCEDLRECLEIRAIPELKITISERERLTTPAEERQLRANLERAEVMIRREAAKPSAVARNHVHPMGIANALALVAPSRAPYMISNLKKETDASAISSLSDEQVPESPNEFVQLFLSRPQDMLAWVKDAKRRLADADLDGEPPAFCHCTS